MLKRMGRILNQNAAWSSIALLVFTALFAYRIIPFASFLGLDFLNVYFFQNSNWQNNPYLNHEFQFVSQVSTLATGFTGVKTDPMNYPPLLYWAFGWTRFFSFHQAYLIWAAGILASVFGVLFYLNRKYSKIPFGMMLLLVVQQPTQFAMERGNNDAFVILIWLAQFISIESERWFLAGILAGIVIALKLYPVIAVFLYFIFLIKAKRSSASKYFMGCAVGGVSVLLLLWPQYRLYFTEFLPEFAKGVSWGLFSHSINNAFFKNTVLSLGLKILLLGTWIFCAVKVSEKRRVLLYFSVLPVATYFAGITYDYNLITMLPLMLFVYSSERLVFLLSALVLFFMKIALSWLPRKVALISGISEDHAYEILSSVNTLTQVGFWAIFAIWLTATLDLALDKLRIKFI